MASDQIIRFKANDKRTVSQMFTTGIDSFQDKSFKVQVLDDIEPGIFCRRYKNQAPVLFKGAVKSWKPCKAWTCPEYLQTALEKTNDKLSVLVSHDNQHFIDNPDLATKQDFLVNDFLQCVFSHGTMDETQRRLYFRSLSMPDNLYNDIIIDSQVRDLFSMIGNKTTLQKDEYEGFIKTVLKQNTMQLWIGTAGNVTPLHYDRNHGLLTQISGRKTIILFSHEDTGSIYPFPSFSAKSHLSKVNLRAVSLERFPKFSRAQPYSCTVDKGDVLYIPPFWWHDVTSVDNCVSVTLSWDLDGHEDIPAAMLR